MNYYQQVQEEFKKLVTSEEEFKRILEVADLYVSSQFGTANSPADSLSGFRGFVVKRFKEKLDT